LNVLASDFPHHIFNIVAVDEIFVVESSQRLRGENFMYIFPLVDKGIHFALVTAIIGNEDLAFRWQIAAPESVSRGGTIADQSLAAIVEAEVSADGQGLVAWSANGNVVSWSVPVRKNTERCNLGQPIRSLCWSSHLARAVSLSPAGKLRVWDLKDFSHPRMTLESDQQQLQGLDLSPSGTAVVLTLKSPDSMGRQANGTCRVVFLSGEQNAVDLKFDGPDDWLDDCYLAPGDRNVLLASGQGRALFFDTTQPSKPRELRDARGVAHQGMMVSPVFSRNGTRVLTFGAVDAEIKIWTLPEGTVDTLVGHGATLTAGALSADESYVVSASEDKAARVWRTEWLPMLHYLRATTTATLTVQQRIRCLGETEEVAARTHARQELQFGRGANGQSSISSPIVLP